MERRLLVLAATAFVVAAVLYSAWMPGQFTSPLVDRTDGLVGELAARDQPSTRLFRTSDVLSGLAIVLGVAVTYRVRREWSGWLALAAFGVLVIAGGLFPLDCAALGDPVCELIPLSLSHHVHVVTGVLATVAVLAAMALLSRCWNAYGAWLITGAALGATALTLAAIAGGYLAGVAQRAQATLTAMWLVYVALRLLVADDPVDGGPGSGGLLFGGSGAHVVVQGEGPVVLISAGLGGAWFHWDRVAAELARSHRVVRFDRPGLGRSSASPAPPTLYGEAARLAALAPAHPGQVIVVAHSVAAWHAEAFVRLHPMCVSRLVLVDPSRADRRRRAASFGRAVGPWLPALGGAWGATALALLAGPVVHRLVRGLPDHGRAYRTGRVLAAAAGEWFARHDMAADLHRVRARHAFPDVPVTVISSRGRARGQKRLTAELNADLVHLTASARRIHLDASAPIADAVRRDRETGSAG
ncbi:alpha/beta fold hydrolase [Nonomuraea sp. NPDC049141]|uniref:alpha/beta fold hydrolase n=1 Tax=Nonomuraea sp. NPDC049141 TaxID=3155500 RepID=UPI0033EE627E